MKFKRGDLLEFIGPITITEFWTIGKLVHYKHDINSETIECIDLKGRGCSNTKTSFRLHKANKIEPLERLPSWW